METGVVLDDKTGARSVTVVVPVYNEEEGITRFIGDLKGALRDSRVTAEIIVVDDFSTDKTGSLAEALDIDVVRHGQRRGYGASLKTGIERARHDLVCIIDGDNSYSPNDILRLVAAAGACDMVVGARFRGGAAMHIAQWAAKSFVCFWLNLFFRAGIKDINSGLRVMKKDIVMAHRDLLCDGFSFTASITLIMLLKRHTIAYLPVSYRRRTGKTKVAVCGYVVGFVRSYLRILVRFLITEPLGHRGREVAGR